MDWKNTLNLPKTEFPMRADLAKREPAWLARWADERQYERILAVRKAAGAPRFILHDGPPYPTGGIHYGTALNKVLKDIVVRSRLMLGYAATFRPGWDCHGLPIEQQVEKDLGGKRRELSVPEFRRRCEAHARKFVDVMRGEFKRLGCLGLWDDPYLTLAPDYESTIVRQLGEFARLGLLYRDKKPVHWCLHHRTALAEAEVEYADHVSPSIYVRFPLEDGLGAVLPAVAGQPAALVIWTTTPWTLPANLAIVANPALDYVAVPIERAGAIEHLVVAQGRLEPFLAACSLRPAGAPRPLPREAFGQLEGARYRHPFMPRRRDVDFRLWFAPHATLEAGTGLVHTAPGHGAEDYGVGRAHGLEIFAPVDEAGRLTDEVPQPFRGLPVFEANPKIVAHLHEAGFLLNQPGESLRHSYPCCWRCKKPVIFRGTEQFFARIGAVDPPDGLRKAALAEIDRTQWIPAWGADRIRGMIEGRPDWCLSRQRTWGVPIPALRCAGCGQVHLFAEVADRTAEIIGREGSNAWFERPVADFLPPGLACPGCDGRAFDKGGDIVDVWFESGVSWAAVCEDKLVPRGEKIDLYLEGSDQHRGWFHSALLTGVATRGRAPYRAVLTHGWVLDERGKVYSKSEIAKAREAGHKLDYVDPSDWMAKNGAELLRLWAAAGDYQGDIVFSQTIVNQLGESFRKVRNTARYLLSNLYDFRPSRDAVEHPDLRELDRTALAVLAVRDADIWDAYRRYEFHVVVRLVVDYCVALSAEYVDAIKDVLYCEAPGGGNRRSAQTVVHEMIKSLATWVAPILCFTAQDIADELARLTGEPFDPHAHLVPDLPAETQKPARRVAHYWQDTLRPRREDVLKAVEPFRAAGHKSLEARVTVRVPQARFAEWMGLEAFLTELCVVSQLAIVTEERNDVLITVDEAPGPECPRCWRRTGAASGDSRDPDLCNRCAAAVTA